MKAKLSRLATRIFDVPLMVHPAKMEALLQFLGPRMFDMPLEMSDEQAREIFAGYGGSYDEGERKPYAVTQDGIAVIPVQGALMKRADWLMSMSGCTSYEQIAKQINAAAEDGGVRGVLLDIDSPGGETHGCFELTDLIYSLRGSKPIYAVANDCAMSAAYAIASACDRIFVTQTGGVGSIGVYALHLDQSGYDEKMGLKYTYIKAGAKKADGNPHEPLSKTAESDAQDEIDRQYGLFTAAVARNRSLPEKKVVATEAGCYFADGAIPMLADDLGTFEDAMAALVAASKKAKTSFVGATAEEPAVTAAIPEVKEPIMAKPAEIPAVAEAPKAKVDDETMDPGYTAEQPDPEEEEEEEEMKETTKPAEATAQKPAISAADVAAITNMCALAGLPATRASKFIAEGVTLADAQKALLDERAEESDGTAVRSQVGPTSTNALDAIEEQAKQMSAQKGITKAQAYRSLLTANPRMYEAYVDWRDQATASKAGKRSYLETMYQRYPVTA